MPDEPAEEGGGLYSIKRSQSGPQTVKLTTDVGSWQLRKGGEGITIPLDDFTLQSLEATGHYEIKASRRKSPVPIPRRKPDTPEEVK